MVKSLSPPAVSARVDQYSSQHLSNLVRLSGMHTADFHVVGGGLDQKVGSLEKRIYKKKNSSGDDFIFFARILREPAQRSLSPHQYSWMEFHLFCLQRWLLLVVHRRQCVLWITQNSVETHMIPGIIVSITNYSAFASTNIHFGFGFFFPLLGFGWTDPLNYLRFNSMSI